MIGERLLNAHAGGRLEIGDGVFFNFGCSVPAHTLVQIGSRCRIGQYAIILDCDYHEPDGSDSHGSARPIVIGDGVWMGAQVTVLEEVTVGEGAVIGAVSVMTGDIPAHTQAAGVPATVVKTI